MTPGLPTTPRAEPLGPANGYQVITNLQAARTDGDWTADFKVAAGQARLTMLGAPGTELFFGQGITYNPPRPCPMVIVRRQGKEAAFTSLLCFGATLPAAGTVAPLPVTLNGQPATAAQAWAMRITQGDREDVLLVASAPGEKSVAGLRTTARAIFATRQGGQLKILQQLD
jgi:hypothetical protein